MVKPGYLSEIFVSFQGEGTHVGRRHLFVRLAGCNIRCRYCDTPDSLERTATYTVSEPKRELEVRRNPATAEELSGIVRGLLASDSPIDGIALTGGEPLTQSEFLAGFLATLRGQEPVPLASSPASAPHSDPTGSGRPHPTVRGPASLQSGRFHVPVLLETNGILPRRLRDVLSLVDIISMDIKLPSNTGEGEFWDAHAEFLELARAKDLYVKILVDAETTAADVNRAARMLAAVNSGIPAFLQPIVDSAGRSTIPAARLTDLYREAWRSLSAVRVLPQTHKLLGLR